MTPPAATTLTRLIAEHMPALERDEARHNLILGILAGAARGAATEIRAWTLGRPGACAIQAPGRPILLGDIAEGECAALADTLRGADVPGVVGPGRAALWLADRFVVHGARFAERIPQQILRIDGPPRFPGVAGEARTVSSGDAALFADWRAAFSREATPHDPEPKRDAVVRAAVSGDHAFWIVNGAPVSVASIGRRTRNGVVINGVYTPPALRGRGFAGSVTAALVARGYAEGKSFACLYVDARNPASNRCYANIGFVPVCESWHCVRG